MIRHIVMWKLKDQANGLSAAENGAKMQAMLEALAGRIEGLRNIAVSMDILGENPCCDILLCSDHDDAAALDHYQNHPEHQACVAFIKGVVSSREAIDFKI